MSMKMNSQKKSLNSTDKQTLVVGIISGFTLLATLIAVYIAYVKIDEISLQSKRDILYWVDQVYLEYPDSATDFETMLAYAIKDTLEDLRPRRGSRGKLHVILDTPDVKSDSGKLRLELEYFSGDSLLRVFAELVGYKLKQSFCDSTTDSSSELFISDVNLVESDNFDLWSIRIKLVREPGKPPPTLILPGVVDILVRQDDPSGLSFADSLKNFLMTHPSVSDSVTIRIKKSPTYYFYNSTGEKVENISVNYYEEDDIERIIADSLAIFLQQNADLVGDEGYKKELRKATTRIVWTDYPNNISIIIPKR